MTWQRGLILILAVVTLVELYVLFRPTASGFRPAPAPIAHDSCTTPDCCEEMSHSQ